MEKQLPFNTRVLSSGKVQIYISKKVALCKANKGILVGWATLTETCGGKKMPPAQDGNGYYLCVSDQWVWFPI